MMEDKTLIPTPVRTGTGLLPKGRRQGVELSEEGIRKG